MAGKAKQVAAEAANEPAEVQSPWTDDSGPDILEIIHNPRNRPLLTPAKLGQLLTVRFLHVSCYEPVLFAC